MSSVKSEIRDSDIELLQKKVSKRNYRKYLRRMKLTKVRSFRDQEIVFEFPVTALIGPNGGGKTTILGAAGLPYKEIPPRRFFAKSGKYDESMLNWSIEYDLIDHDIKSAKSDVQRTASFKRRRWNRDALDREVLVFGVARTLPASERSELKKALGSKFVALGENLLADKVSESAENILGKSIRDFRELSIDKSGTVTLLTVKNPSVGYSEFHFGAGEASVIKMIADIESADDNSLILIEEIENGLHPVATRRLVEYLLDVAKRKNVQVIFTTHSNDAIAPLSETAIWSAYSGNVIQGRLDVRTLRVLSGQVDTKLAVYVEDAFAVMMVKTALGSKGIPLDMLQIHGVGGFGHAIKFNEQRNIDPARSFSSICILDGDQKGRESVESRIFLLPGETSPEEYVFDYVFDNVSLFSAKLSVAFYGTPDRQQEIIEKVQNRHFTNRDRHMIFSQLGEDFGYLGRDFVAQVFLTLWASNSDDCEAFVKSLESVFATAGILDRNL